VKVNVRQQVTLL